MSFPTEPSLLALSGMIIIRPGRMMSLFAEARYVAEPIVSLSLRRSSGAFFFAGVHHVPIESIYMNSFATMQDLENEILTTCQLIDENLETSDVEGLIAMMEDVSRLVWHLNQTAVETDEWSCFESCQTYAEQLQGDLPLGPMGQFVGNARLTATTSIAGPRFGQEQAMIQRAAKSTA